MDIVIRLNSNPVNDMTMLLSWLSNNFDKIVKNMNNKISLVGECSGLSMWIFVLTTRQTIPGRLFT